jgi:hypothetical protein
LTYGAKNIEANKKNPNDALSEADLRTSQSQDFFNIFIHFDAQAHGTLFTAACAKAILSSYYLA